MDVCNILKREHHKQVSPVSHLAKRILTLVTYTQKERLLRGRPRPLEFVEFVVGDDSTLADTLDMERRGLTTTRTRPNHHRHIGIDPHNMAARRRTAPAIPLLLLLFVVLQMVSAFRFCPSSSRPQPQKPGAPPAPAATLLLQRWGMLALAVVGPALILPTDGAFAFDAKGAKLFEENCSSCHVGGSNIIGYARAKTLKVRDWIAFYLRGSSSRLIDACLI